MKRNNVIHQEIIIAIKHGKKKILGGKGQARLIQSSGQSNHISDEETGPERLSGQEL